MEDKYVLIANLGRGDQVEEQITIVPSVAGISTESSTWTDCRGLPGYRRDTTGPLCNLESVNIFTHHRCLHTP